MAQFGVPFDFTLHTQISEFRIESSQLVFTAVLCINAHLPFHYSLSVQLHHLFRVYADSFELGSTIGSELRSVDILLPR